LFKETFIEIFTLLDEIDNKLSAADQEEVDLLTQKIIQIRKQMDKYINYWLKFEEKINYLEDKYKLNLPDELCENLSDGLLDNLEHEHLEEKHDDDISQLDPNKIDESEMPGKIKEDMFYTIEDIECIGSFRKGLGYFDLSMMEEAATEFRKVVEKEPNFLIGHFYLGMAYAEMSLYEKALNEFRLILALSQNDYVNAIIHNFKGNIYAEKEQFEKALEEFKKALDFDNNFIDVFFNTGATLYNMGKYQDSIEYFKKALKYYHEDWELFYYIGKAYGNLGQFQEAIYYIERSAELNSSYAAIHLELGVLYELIGEKNKAREHYSKIKGY